MNYPLARSARTKANWRKDEQACWCRLPGDDRIELSLPADAPAELQRCPTGFDTNVLFRLLAAVQHGQPQRIERVKFASIAAGLRDLHLTPHTENSLRFVEALEFWSQISIRFNNWYAHGSGDEPRIVRELPPPILRADQSGYSFALTLHPDWVRLALSKKYYAPIPLPLPSEAAAQNMVLMLLTSMQDSLEGKIRRAYSRQRRGFCRKIGLRCESAKLQRTASIANEWFMELGGSLVAIDGATAPREFMAKPGQIEFVFEMIRIPRRKTRRSKGLDKQKPDGQRGVESGKPDGRRGHIKNIDWKRRTVRKDTAGAARGRCRSEGLDPAGEDRIASQQRREHQDMFERRQTPPVYYDED